jgi:hypothetical protein
MIPRLLSPLLRYRGAVEQLGPPFLVLCAIALPCWVIFRRYRRRASGLPLSSRRELLLVLAVVYFIGIVTVTLAPTHASRARAAALRAEPAASIELQPNLASLTCSASRASPGLATSSHLAGADDRACALFEHRARSILDERVGNQSLSRRQRCHPEHGGSVSWTGGCVTAAVSPGDAFIGPSSMTPSRDRWRAARALSRTVRCP